jgi:hypothetical protein
MTEPSIIDKIYNIVCDLWPLFAIPIGFVLGIWLIKIHLRPRDHVIWSDGSDVRKGDDK